MRQSSRLRSAASVLGPALLALALLAGCGSTSKSATSKSSVADALVQLFPDNFTSVCQGVGQSRARAYSSSAAGHKALYIQTYQDHLQDDSQELPTDWTVQFDANTDAYATVDVVGCGVRSASAFLKECTGYQSDGKDTGQKVRLFTATYKLTAVEAKTAKVLGSSSLTADSSDCPMFQTFEKGQKSVDVYQSPVKDDIIAFLRPFVQPAR